MIDAQVIVFELASKQNSTDVLSQSAYHTRAQMSRILRGEFWRGEWEWEGAN